MALILLAEADAPTIDQVRTILASQGWQVRVVKNRDEALRVASEYAPELVLLDARMKGADDLIRTFSRHRGGPGVVLMSGKEEGDIGPLEISDEADAVLVKPVRIEELIETVRAGISSAASKKPAEFFSASDKIFTTQEIFGDLLEDLLDEDQPVIPTARPAAPEAGPDAGDVLPFSHAEEKPAEAANSDTAVIEAQTPAEPPPEPVAAPAPQPLEAEPPEPVAAPAPQPLEAAPPEAVEAPPPEPLEAEPPEPPAPEVEPEVPVFAPDELLEEVVAAGELEAEAAAAPAGVMDLSDLEALAQETVPALVESALPDPEPEPEPVQPKAIDIDAELQGLLSDSAREVSEPAAPVAEEDETDLDQDLEARLNETLAGVVADALAGPESRPASQLEAEEEAGEVDNLLAQALGKLRPTVGPPAEEERVKAAPPEAEEPPDEAEDETTAPDLLVEAIRQDAAADQMAAVMDVHGISAETEEDAGFELADAEPAAEPGPPAQVAEELAYGEEFGDYTLEERIGLGGMAEVWKARRKGVEGFEKRVAIKRILPQPAENEEFVNMFIDEAKLAAQLNHNNITHIYDLGKVDGDYFIAMEYVAGKNLRHLLDAGRKVDNPLPSGLALYIAARIADALDYAHRSKGFDNAELGLVHRDVSPQNVLISYEGDIKLCDFGIAKAVSKMSTTQMGALKGKLQYMSPEQAWGLSIDHRSDIFSTGTLLFEMLAAERLFSGDSEISILEAVRECAAAERVIQSTAIPGRAKGLLLKALAKEADERFQNAAELQAGLEELLGEQIPIPGQKELAAYVHGLLEVPEEVDVMRDAVGMEVEAPIEAPVEAPAVPANGAGPIDETPQEVLTPLPDELVVAEAEEELSQPSVASRVGKWLLRLLPALAVIGLTAYFASARTDTVRIPVRTPTARPAAVNTAPRVSAVEPSAAEPSQQGPAADATSEPAPSAAVPAAAPPPGNPEVERQVAAELQRVQELVTSVPQTAATVRTGDLVEPGPGVVAPRVVSFEAPEYSDEARRLQTVGTVRVEVLVDENGQVIESRLLQGLVQQTGLDEATLAAARVATFRPATKDGVPVKMWHELSVRYEP